MAWGPIVVGVDASLAAVGAADLGERLATLAGVRCELVHAVRDAWAPLVAVSPDPQVVEMQDLQLAVARETITRTLAALPGHPLQHLDVAFGPPAVILQEIARTRQAGM